MHLSDEEKRHREIVHRFDYLTTLIVRVRTDQKVLREHFTKKDWRIQKQAAEIRELRKKVAAANADDKLMKRVQKQLATALDLPEPQAYEKVKAVQREYRYKRNNPK